MLEWLHNFTEWAATHQQWALALIFVTSFLDCLFVIGLIFVSAPFIYGAGALVAVGALDFWPVVIWMALGGIAGDVVSYYLGRRYGVALFRSAFFAKRPALAERGRRFFDKHGGKGLVLAHNIGVLRPLLPAIAGVYGLTPLRFFAATLPAALIWALLCTMIGVAAGASIGLTAEVAKRLAVLVVGAVALLWLSSWLIWLVARLIRSHAQGWLSSMLTLSREHRILGKLGPALADPEQPETPALALFALLLLALSAGALLAVWGVAPRALPPAADLAVFQTLRSLQEPWATHLAVFFSLLGEWPVYLPYAGVAMAVLAWSGQRRAAAHWLAALLFGGAITLGLSLVPNISNPLEYSGLVAGAHFPRDLVVAAIVYGYTPVLLRRKSLAPYLIAFGALLLIVLSRLYLGTLWLSVGVVAVACGLLWVGALGVGYRLHVERQDVRLVLLAPALAALALAAVWHLQRNFDARRLEHTPAPVVKPMDADAWWQHGWMQLRARRQDVAGHDKQFLNVQWAGDLDTIRAALLASGWQSPPPLTLGNALHWLSSDTPIDELPLLPRYHEGQHQALRLRLSIDGEQQYSLLLWPARYRLDGETPLWTGTLARQRVREAFRVFRYPINEDSHDRALDAFVLPEGYDMRRIARHGQRPALLLLRPATVAPPQDTAPSAQDEPSTAP